MNKEIRYKGMISNKTYKIINTIIWVCALYQLNEVKGDIKEYKRITRIK